MMKTDFTQQQNQIQSASLLFAPIFAIQDAGDKLAKGEHYVSC